MHDINTSEHWHLVVRDSRKYQAYSGQRCAVGELLDTVHRDELGVEAVDYARGIEWIPADEVESPRTPEEPPPAPEPLIEYRIVERVVEVPVERIVEKIVERVVEVPVECCRFCRGWRRFLAGLRNCFRVRV